MEFLVALLALLVFARLLGEAGERVGIPALVGELCAGVLLGPAVLGWIAPTQALDILASLGIFFLVYLAGLELRLVDLTRSLRGRGVAVAVASFAFPLALGIAVAYSFQLAPAVAAFVGIALALTALPVSVYVLTYLGKLNTEWGRTIIVAGLLCDIAGLAVFGLLNTWTLAGFVVDAQTVLLLGLKVGLFVSAIVATDRALRLRDRAAGRWLRRQSERFLSKGASFGLPLAAALAFGFLADALGLHYVVGVFFGTLLLAEHLIPEPEAKKVRNATSLITSGLLAPVFFAVIGLQFTIPGLGALPLLGSLLGAAVAGKVAGGYLGAAFARFKGRERWAIGFGMNGRGAMELVIATIGLEAGIIDATVFSLLVFIGVVTTVMTPIALKRIIRPATPSPAPAEGPTQVYAEGAIRTPAAREAQPRLEP